jgi:hypothetical protein
MRKDLWEVTLLETEACAQMYQTQNTSDTPQTTDENTELDHFLILLYE